MAIGNLPIGVPSVLTASKQVTTGQGALIGFLVTSSSGLTLAAIDSAASTGGTNIFSTTAVITAPAYIPCPVGYANGLYVTIGGTGSVTVIYV